MLGTFLAFPTFSQLQEKESEHIPSPLELLGIQSITKPLERVCGGGSTTNSLRPVLAGASSMSKQPHATHVRAVDGMRRWPLTIGSTGIDWSVILHSFGR